MAKKNTLEALDSTQILETNEQVNLSILSMHFYG